MLGVAVFLGGVIGGVGGVELMSWSVMYGAIDTTTQGDFKYII